MPTGRCVARKEKGKIEGWEECLGKLTCHQVVLPPLFPHPPRLHPPPTSSFLKHPRAHLLPFSFILSLLFSPLYFIAPPNFLPLLLLRLLCLLPPLPLFCLFFLLPSPHSQPKPESAIQLFFKCGTIRKRENDGICLWCIWCRVVVVLLLVCLFLPCVGFHHRVDYFKWASVILSDVSLQNCSTLAGFIYFVLVCVLILH